MQKFQSSECIKTSFINSKPFLIPSIFILYKDISCFLGTIWRCVWRARGNPQYWLCLEAFRFLLQFLVKHYLQNSHSLFWYLYRCRVGRRIRLYRLLPHLVHHSNSAGTRHQLQRYQETCEVLYLLLLWAVLWIVWSNLQRLQEITFWLWIVWDNVKRLKGNNAFVDRISKTMTIY